MVHDSHGNMHETPKGIIQTFARYLREKYAPIAVDATCIEVMAEVIRQNSPGSCAESLEQPITLDELRAALRKGGRNKAPGSDGIGLEFYTTNWEFINEDIHEIMNQILIQRCITAQQKYGVIVCLPKSSAALTPNEYRPITLLKHRLQDPSTHTGAPLTSGARTPPPDQSVLRRPRQFHRRGGVYSTRSNSPKPR
jgi:hypothetical protein